MKSKFLLLAVIAISLILSAKQSTAQTTTAMPMGDLTAYVVFTGAGNITDAKPPLPKSTYVGIIGTASGTIAISPSTGATTNAAGTGTTAQTLTDLNTLYSQLTGLTTTALIPPTTLGLTNTITSGVYNYSSLSSIAGNLILDGQNSKTNKFVFIYENGLTIDALTNMKLLNGANSDSIFWIIKSGVITINSNVTLIGNFISNTANITVPDLVNLTGRLASISGAIDITHINASNTSITAPLPVKFTSLTGQCDNNRMVIKFATASEQNNNYFTVQQSIDAQNWTAKSKIIGAGNSASLKNYSFTDSSASASVSYYRIMQTDMDGTSLYSNVISVNSCGNGNAVNVSAYPNPSTGNFKVAYSGDRNQVSKTVVLDFNGKKVFEAKGLRAAIDLTNKPTGMYMVQVIVNATIYSTKVMVQK